MAGEQPAFLDAQALSNWKDLLAQRLPPYMVPSELVACPALPMSNNHKIDRKKLIDICRDTRAAACADEGGRMRERGACRVDRLSVSWLYAVVSL